MRAKLPDIPALFAPAAATGPDPYGDFSRVYTADGGVALAYKDLDERLRYTLRRILLWLLATGAAGYYTATLSPIQSPLIRLLLLLALGFLNWLIVRKPIEVYRTIEIRPDCMILEGQEVFWRHKMEGVLPSFQRNAKGHHILCGIYGVRWTEYLSIRRFDELDRSPEVLAGHLHAAMQQQWSPLGRGSD